MVVSEEQSLIAGDTQPPVEHYGSRSENESLSRMSGRLRVMNASLLDGMRVEIVENEAVSDDRRRSLMTAACVEHAWLLGSYEER